MKEQKSSSGWARAIAAASSAGFTIAASIGAGVFIGYYLDQYFGFSPWGTVMGAFIGAVVGFWSLCKQILQDTKDNSNV